jgi:hypothetical protein
MAPFFARIESGVLATAAERKDELIKDIFQGQRWYLTLVEGAVKAGVDPCKAIPVDREIEVSCSGLAMLEGDGLVDADVAIYAPSRRSVPFPSSRTVRGLDAWR